jgi:hypothetical protein
MRRRTSPGFAEWLFVTFAITGALLIFYQLYQYGSARELFPVGLEVAGVDVGGLSRAEAERRLIERYLNTPIIVYHRRQMVDVMPSRAEFRLNMEAMMVRALQERDQQDYWAGFWGYLWGRSIDVSPVPLDATHNEVALRETLRIIADQFDTPPLPPSPSGSSMSFQYGDPGVRTVLDASLPNVAAAFYRQRAREAHLTLEVVPVDRPTINLLATLLTNTIQEFQARSGGIAGIHVIDLATGQEISNNARLPLTGTGVLKIPVMLETVRFLGHDLPVVAEEWLRSAATEMDSESANELLRIIAGQEKAEPGVAQVNGLMQALGLENSYLGCPFGAAERECERYRTPANEIGSPLTAPDPFWQTTAEDMAVLLAQLHYCAVGDAGTLRVIYPDLSADLCARLLDIMATNRIGSLIEQGVPPGVILPHRHAWQTDLYIDAGIVYSAGGAYVVVIYAHKPGWLAWEEASPLIADLSRGVYNYFNFDNPWLSR